MADKRKLQTDIEKTLKKVQEGRILFQDILNKYEEAKNQTQKEKFEADLKKEIKKLQRFRDQIKTWHALNEIKDKSSLIDARKYIEQLMERFKVIEKETKTKAYSKEGLLNTDSKKDPMAKEREDLVEWLKHSISEFQTHSERLEFSIESFVSSVKKKRGDRDKDALIATKKTKLGVSNFHIERLETTLRHFDNERIEIDQIKAIKSSLEYILETFDDENFMDDREIYNELCLDDLGDSPIVVPAGGVGPGENDGTTTGSNSSSRITTGDSSEFEVPIITKPPIEEPKFDFTTSTPVKAVEKPVVKAKSARDPANQSAPPGLATSTVSLPVVAPVVTPQKSVKEPVSAQNKTTKPLDTQAAVSGKTSSVVKNLSGTKIETNEAIAQPVLGTIQQIRKSRNTPPPANFEVGDLNDSISSTQSTTAAPSNNPRSSMELKTWPYPTDTANSSSAASPLHVVPATSPHSYYSPLVMLMVNKAKDNSAKELESSSSNTTNASKSAMHHPLSSGPHMIHPKDAAAPFRNKILDTSRSNQFPAELQSQMRALNNAFNHLPNPCDTEKSRMTICKNLCSIPSHYPKEPPKMTDTEDYYSELDVQTLFFIFYYFEGTRAQYLAAKSLKRLSWRFHTKLMLWFQRHEEPKKITEEYESGTYIYYDYKTMIQRKKEDFLFEYNYLEDRDF